ncbi:hypothetical protein FKM82_020607 [Ascaphus truei]
MHESLQTVQSGLLQVIANYATNSYVHHILQFLNLQIYSLLLCWSLQLNHLCRKCMCKSHLGVFDFPMSPLQRVMGGHLM